ncbi:ATP-binding protein [candidate division KSB1 bacterium]|nr:ATP-binding protein [candidate division KSB1 bacterium]
MKRDIYQKLLNWKSSPRRKPLLLKGARQVGKTYILQQFGKQEYSSVAYLNFEEEPLLDDFFTQSLAPEKIIGNLSLYFKQKIKPKHDLIIFDEIQASNNALNSLKYFNEKANEYHIMAAGSLLGIKLSKPKSFPVGKINFLNMYPLTFLEFLEAIDQKELRKLIENTSCFNPYPELFHQELINLLRTYYYVGGMPEAVQYFSETNDFFKVREIQKEIINSYILDFAKHAPTQDIPKLGLIWDSIPAQLGKENKKFIFTALKKTARARDYENALKWLEDTGLILPVNLVKAGKIPLKGYSDPGIFKIYVLDVGLLGALAKIPPDILTLGDKLFTEFKGAFVENYVTQQLKSQKEIDLYYWKSAGSAEIDFICEYKNNIFPLEAKSGINPRSKSLLFYDQKYNPNILSRATLLNLKQNCKICNYPLYAISLFPELSEAVVNA